MSLTEGKKGKTTSAKFSVTLSAASTRIATVTYATANGPAPGDYTAKSGTLSFSPGDTSKTVSVTVKGDSSREPNETFGVNLSDSANASLADSQGIGTIRNDD